MQNLRQQAVEIATFYNDQDNPRAKVHILKQRRAFCQALQALLNDPKWITKVEGPKPKKKETKFPEPQAPPPEPTNAYEAYDSRPIGGGKQPDFNAYQAYDDRPIGGGPGPSVEAPVMSFPNEPKQENRYKTTYQKKIKFEEVEIVEHNEPPKKKSTFLKRGQGVKYDPKKAIKESKTQKKKQQEEEERLREEVRKEIEAEQR